MVKNLPANVADTSLIPDMGRLHMLGNNETHVPHLLSPQPTAGAPQPERSHRIEEPTLCNKESPPPTATRERPGAATKTQRNQNKSSQINKWGGLKQLKTIKKIITSFIYCWLPWVSLAESGLSLAAVHRLFTAVASLVADQGL